MSDDELKTVKTARIGSIILEYEHRSPKCFWGRFGGGWNWELGIQAASGCIIFRLLTFSISVIRVREKKSSPLLDSFLTGRPLTDQEVMELTKKKK